MKTKILSLEGKSKEIELPECFSQKIREDICQKVFETEKKWQAYAPYFLAGKQASASGKIKHGRRKWKTAYGHGISRVPRKIFWRRGNQFYWVGATISSARKGRRAHPPRIEHFLKKLKINKKEKLLAMNSALAATCSLDYLKRRYSSLENKKIAIGLPLVIESKILELKAKEFYLFLEKVFGEIYSLAIQKKKIRAGKGKARGRKYKKNAGLLLVISRNEDFRIKGIDIKKVNHLKMEDFWPLGRLAVYTENAIKDLAGNLK